MIEDEIDEDLLCKSNKIMRFIKIVVYYLSFKYIKKMVNYLKTNTFKFLSSIIDHRL